VFERRDISIDPNGSFISVQIICGFAQHIDFDFDLFDSQGNNPQRLPGGSNIHSDPPPFVLNILPSQLPGRFLLVTATVQSLGGNNFSVDAIFSQGGQEKGRISVQGTFTDTKTVSLVARFV
jgi:hypothetical protein